MICFATHGNSTVGMGHIVRSLTLAQELRRQTDERIVFSVPHEDGVARYQVIASGFGFLGAADEPRVVVSDFSDGRVLQANGSLTVALADVASETKPAALTFAVFRGRAVDHPGLFAGPGYAILRPQFRTARRTERPMRIGPPKVLMSFGGADPADLLDLATQALATTPYTLTAILGPAYRHKARYIESWGTRVETHSPGVTTSTPMAEYMAAVDLLVCSGGMTPLEAACVGTPTIILAQHAREDERMRCWQGAWTGYYLGLGSSLRAMDVQASTVKLLGDDQTLAMMSHQGVSVVDGRGAQRVAQALLLQGAGAVHAA